MPARSPGRTCFRRRARIPGEGRPLDLWSETRRHFVEDEGIPLRTIAEVAGRHLKLPVVSVASEDASKHFGWLAMSLAMNTTASNAITRELLGWQPTHPGLIEDLEAGHYTDGR